MKNFYQGEMSKLFSLKFTFIPAILFYLFYLLGIFIFVLYPNLKTNNTQVFLLYGALFGFFCYMTYDLVNMATIKDWPWKLTIIDITWGIFITSLISFISYKIYFWI
jgi:uncharacterized membrane protein